MSELQNEAEKVVKRYAARAGSIKDDRYSMLNPAVWQGVQERQRVLLQLLAQYSKKPLVDLRVLEVGCGSGGNLLELLRMGFSPANLVGNELLQERSAAARLNLPEIGEEEIAEVVQALRSGWVTTGPKAKQFEADFAAYLGGGVEAIAVNSATAGLHLGLEAMGIGPGDEVITTTHTFTATAEIIRYLGADPVFVDVDADTLCIDVDAVARVITPRTKAIIPVHFAGRSADMTRLLALAKQHGLKVMEDAAHALPTTCDGALIGTLASDVTVFSFYANKTITTGEGGMLVTRDPEIAKRARVMRLHGINRDAFDRFTSKAPSWYYEIVAPGFKYNMTDIAASMGIHQLKKANAFQRKRAHIAALYDEALAGLPIIRPPHAAAGDVHSWHLYVTQLADGAGVARDVFIERLFEQGIGCSVHYIPLHLQPYWRDTYKLTPEMFPVSQQVYERTVSLPLYTRMTDADVARVVVAVKVALG